MTELDVDGIMVVPDGITSEGKDRFGVDGNVGS